MLTKMQIDAILHRIEECNALGYKDINVSIKELDENEGANVGIEASKYIQKMFSVSESGEVKEFEFNDDID